MRREMGHGKDRDGKGVEGKMEAEDQSHRYGQGGHAHTRTHHTHIKIRDGGDRVAHVR